MAKAYKCPASGDEITRAWLWSNRMVGYCPTCKKVVSLGKLEGSAASAKGATEKPEVKTAPQAGAAEAVKPQRKPARASVRQPKPRRQPAPQPLQQPEPARRGFGERFADFINREW